jgi:hypothetical protein
MKNNISVFLAAINYRKLNPTIGFIASLKIALEARRIICGHANAASTPLAVPFMQELPAIQYDAFRTRKREWPPELISRARVRRSNDLWWGKLPEKK